MVHAFSLADGADTTFNTALSSFTGFLEGSGGKIITVMSLAGGLIALASGRFAMTALVFALAWLKGLGVLLEFMELRHAPRGWRWALVGGFSAVVGLVLLAAALARN